MLRFGNYQRIEGSGSEIAILDKKVVKEYDADQVNEEDADTPRGLLKDAEIAGALASEANTAVGSKVGSKIEYFDHIEHSAINTKEIIAFMESLFNKN